MPVSLLRIRLQGSTVLLGFGLSVLCLLFAAEVAAQTTPSPRFTVRDAGLNGGGGVATAGNFLVTSSLGGASPAGTVSGGRFVLYSGMPAPFAGQAAILVIHDPQSGGGVATGGTAQTVTAQIVTNDAPLASATLFYRAGSDTAATAVSMTEDPSGFTATIPGAAVNETGLTYFFEVEDQNGTTVRAPEVGVFSLPVRLTGGIQKVDGQTGGTDAGAYRLISMPITIDDPRPQDVLGDDIPTLASASAYDPTAARLFEPIGTRVAEFPGTGNFERGRAFWLIVRDGVQSFDSGTGTANVLNEPVTLELRRGWNFIGTPFTVPVPVANLEAVGDTSFTLRSYGANGYNTPDNPVTEMAPFAGYAVFVASDTRLTMNPPLLSSEQAKRAASDDDGWSLRWSLRIRGTSSSGWDADNVAGVHASATHEWDRFDWPEPPSIGGGLSIAFDAPEGAPDGVTLSADVRGEVADGAVWPFAIRTAAQGTVRLSVDGVETIPGAFEVWLLDVETRSTWNLRTNAQARLTTITDGDERPMRLLVGTKRYVETELRAMDALPLKYALDPPYPNPSVGPAAVQIGLPERSRVTIDVYNILGQQIARLKDRESMAAGYHTVVWDAPRLASGLYFVRMRAGSFTATQKLVRIR